MTSITTNLQQVQDRIRRAERAGGRAPGSVQLLAVSKTQPAAAIREAAAAGQTRFGESYLQEALGKVRDLADLDLEWHFIGPIQSNKTKSIAEHFDWVHSIDRATVAQRLDRQRPPGLPALHVCLQVNISGEASKSGVAPEQLEELVAAVAALPRLRLRGLMAIPAPCTEADGQRAAFRVLRLAWEQLRQAGYALDTLSMGMSGDLEAAIAEGATIVRVGTDIFGARAARPVND